MVFRETEEYITFMYLDKAQFAAEIDAYYDTGVMTDALTDMLLHIIEGVIRRYLYDGLDVDEVVGEATYRCYRALSRGNVKTKKNAFSYFSTISMNVMRGIAKKKASLRDKTARYASYLEHRGDCLFG